MDGRRAFKQVDVFTAVALRGNPVAVVMDAEGLSDEQMQRFANWTNLSETTFLLPPTDPAADYRVRIFTPDVELPFAGHPTIGTCHAWLEAGGQPAEESRVVQECGLGLVSLRSTPVEATGRQRLAFAAPSLLRSGPVDESLLSEAAAVLAIDRGDIVDAQWADNGPGWIAVRLAEAQAVLDLTPNFTAAESYDIGVVGPYPLGVVGTAAPGQQPAIEVRAFFRAGASPAEDPVTGSLNAAVAQWLLGSGELEAPYVASQGTVMGRAGRVYVDEAEGEIWVGGDAVTVIDGSVLVP